MEDQRRQCRFGECCNRQDSEHLATFDHKPQPKRQPEKIVSWRSNAKPIERSPCILDVPTEIDVNDDEDEEGIGSIEVVVPEGRMAEKLKNAAPYNYFLTTVASSEPTHTEPLSINFLEILDKSLGELESSVQLTYMLDIFWLLTKYKQAGYLDKPLFIIYGDEEIPITDMKPKVTLKYIKPPIGIHHTKMMLLGYTDGSMRVVMGSANLYEADWYNRTQGLWISNTLSRLPRNVHTSTGESPTGFRKNLIHYLTQYRNENLQPWIDRIRKTDFRSVKVFLVASVPGYFRDPRRANIWGHLRLGFLLEKYSSPIAETAPIIAQSSSIGVMGSGPNVWIESNVINSFRKNRSTVEQPGKPELKMIYPSTKNFENCYVGGECLPYEDRVNKRQLWFKSYLYQWKATKRFRTQAMPHMKAYFRYSDKGLHWFVLTSSNFSKSAWGFTKNVDSSLRYQIFNYEAGILYLPEFVVRKGVFPIDSYEDGIPPFPMPYDLPLTQYEPDDYPKVVIEEPDEEKKDEEEEELKNEEEEELKNEEEEEIKNEEEEELKKEEKKGPKEELKEEPKE